MAEGQRLGPCAWLGEAAVGRGVPRTRCRCSVLGEVARALGKALSVAHGWSRRRPPGWNPGSIGGQRRGVNTLPRERWGSRAGAGEGNTHTEGARGRGQGPLNRVRGHPPRTAAPVAHAGSPVPTVGWGTRCPDAEFEVKLFTATVGRVVYGEECGRSGYEACHTPECP